MFEGQAGTLQSVTSPYLLGDFKQAAASLDVMSKPLGHPMHARAFAYAQTGAVSHCMTWANLLVELNESEMGGSIWLAGEGYLLLLQTPLGQF